MAGSRDRAVDADEVRQLESGEGLPPSVSEAPSPAPAAEEDVLIERPDLGPGVFTQVRAGDRIPAGLEEFPQQPATAPAGARRGTSRRRSRPSA